jgi:hypothetical protein
MVEACLFQLRVKPEVLEVCMESLLNSRGILPCVTFAETTSPFPERSVGGAENKLLAVAQSSREWGGNRASAAAKQTRADKFSNH